MRGDPLDHSGEGRLLERQGRMTAPPGDRGQLEWAYKRSSLPAARSR
jgi:hypothetical protein